MFLAPLGVSIYPSMLDIPANANAAELETVVAADRAALRRLTRKQTPRRWTEIRFDLEMQRWPWGERRVRVRSARGDTGNLSRTAQERLATKESCYFTCASALPRFSSPTNSPNLERYAMGLLGLDPFNAEPS